MGYRKNPSNAPGFPNAPLFLGLVRELVVAMAQAGLIVPVLGPRVVAVRRGSSGAVYAEFR